MDTDRSSILLEVPAKLSCSQLVRQTVRQALDMTPMPACWVYRLMLVLDELFMNAVKYGSGRSDTVVIEVQRRKNGVVLRVSDAGKGGMTPQRLSRLVRSNAEREGILHTSGRGLALIAKGWSDRMAIRRSRRGGITVEVEKHFATAERDALPQTKIRPKKDDASTLIVQLREPVFQPESNQEFLRLLDVLQDAKYTTVTFDCAEIGQLETQAFTRLVELYMAVVRRGGTLQWLHTPTFIKGELRHLQLLDKI